jgi:hypothetical protein
MDITATLRMIGTSQPASYVPASGGSDCERRGGDVAAAVPGGSVHVSLPPVSATEYRIHENYNHDNIYAIAHNRQDEELVST